MKKTIFKIALTAGSITLLAIPVMGVIVYELTRKRNDVTSL